MKKKNIQNKKNNQGFTLIELLAVMAIMTLISTIVLAKHSNFGTKVLLRSLAYEIALSVRETQTFGISSRQFSGSGYKSGYGMHFDSANRYEYIQFADSTKNTVYDGSSELVKRFSINPRYVIKDLCAKPIGGSLTCGLSKIDVSFIRPNPDANIRANGDTTTGYEEARIVVGNRIGEESKRVIVVGIAGQIAVDKF